MQHTCSPNQGEQGLSSASRGLEFMKVRGSALPVFPFPGKGVQVPASPMGHRNVCLVGTLPLQQPLGKYLSGDNTKYSRDQLT